jgi:hypothetical protein
MRWPGGKRAAMRLLVVFDILALTTLGVAALVMIYPVFFAMGDGLGSPHVRPVDIIFAFSIMALPFLVATGCFVSVVFVIGNPKFAVVMACMLIVAMVVFRARLLVYVLAVWR